VWCVCVWCVVCVCEWCVVCVCVCALPTIALSALSPSAWKTMALRLSHFTGGLATTSKMSEVNVEQRELWRRMKHR